MTYAWSDLDKLVGGLPRSAYEYSAYWKGARGGWPGFTTVDVRVGESVTFVRIADTPPAELARRVAPPQGGPQPSRVSGEKRPDLVLVGCVKSKLPLPAPAKDLYISALFRKEREYAEHLGVLWFILSAEHGLVAPDTILEPYDRQLSKTSRDYRLAWGRQVIVDLNRVAGDLQGRTIEIHAGSAYADAIRDGLLAAGADVVEPLAGLPMGSRLAWYGKSKSIADEPNDSDVSVLVKQLTDFWSWSPTGELPRSAPGTQGVATSTQACCPSSKW
nr:DUF6884 domain-containing protein [Raineyella antarctica]